MALDADVNRIVKWAGSADANVDTNVAGLTRAQGWGSTYSVVGSGDYPQRLVFNQLFRELTAAAVELNTRGLLGWHTAVAYTHPAITMGSDGELYLSQQNSTGVDPTSDSDQSHWRALAAEADANTARSIGVHANNGAAFTASLAAPTFARIQNVTTSDPDGTGSPRVRINVAAENQLPYLVIDSIPTGSSIPLPYPRIYTGGYFENLRLHAAGSNQFGIGAPIYLRWTGSAWEFSTSEGFLCGTSLFSSIDNSGRYDVILDIEAGWSARQILQSGIGTIPVWATVDVSGASPDLIASDGLASITSVSAGTVRLNFAAEQSDTDYGVLTSSDYTSTNFYGTRLVGSVEISFHSTLCDHFTAAIVR